MEDFYQFSSVIGRLLQTYPVTITKIYGKSIQNHFASVITLTKQIQQHNDKPFQAILRRVKKSFLNNNNIAILNNKVAATISIHNTDEQVIIVQQNTIQYTINQIQIRQFAKTNNCNVILFFIQHSCTKKDKGQIVDNTDLLTEQDDEGICIEPGILYYCREMVACLLTNLNTQLGIVNRV